MRILCVDDEPLALDELRYLIQEITPEAEVETTETIKGALLAFLTTPFDLVFLDIHLNNESGLQLAAAIQTMAKKPFFVFATAYDQYAVKAFELEALDYILKPYDPKRVKEVLQKAEKALSRQTYLTPEPASLDTLPVKVDDRYIMVNIMDILAVEASGKNLILHTRLTDYTIPESLKSFVSKLPKGAFLQVHRSFYIQYKKIVQIDSWFNQTYLAVFSNGLKVPVSRTYVKEFKDKVGII